MRLLLITLLLVGCAHRAPLHTPPPPPHGASRAEQAAWVADALRELDDLRGLSAARLARHGSDPAQRRCLERTAQSIGALHDVAVTSAGRFLDGAEAETSCHRIAVALSKAREFAYAGTSCPP